MSIGSEAYLRVPLVCQEREKIGVEADDGPQEEVRLKVFRSKEGDVRLPFFTYVFTVFSRHFRCSIYTHRRLQQTAVSCKRSNCNKASEF